MTDFDDPTPLLDTRPRRLFAKFHRKHRGGHIEMVGRVTGHEQVFELVSVTPNRGLYCFRLPRSAIPMLKKAIDDFEASCGEYRHDTKATDTFETRQKEREE